MYSAFIRRTLALAASLLGLGASTVHALPTGTQTILPPTFNDLGANLESTYFILSGTHPLEIGPAGNGQGAYLNSSASSGSITVTAKPSVASFQLTGIVFDEWEAADNFTITVVGTRTDNTTLTSPTITGTTGDDTYTLNLSSFSGVQLKSFEVQVSNPGRQIINFSIVSFTVAGAQAPDTTPPTISIGAPSASLTRSGPVSYTVTYADDNFSASTLAAGHITLNATGTANASVAVTGTGTTRTVTLSSITGDGTLGISIAAGTASDTAGNLAPAAGPSTTFTVDNTPPSITSTLGASGTYGTALTTYTITASGSPVSYSASGLPAGLSVNTGNGQITGTPQTSGNFNVTIGATDAAGNLGTATLALSIAQKTLTVSGVTANNKTYDGNTSATLNFGSASLVGVIGGDSVSLNTASASGSFATKDVGTGKTVTVSGLALSGSGAGNYSLTQPTTTANITAAGLTVSGVTANNKTYDGNTSATLNLGSASLVDAVGGDSVSLNTASASGSFATKDVGTGKTVTVSGLTLSGSDAANYSLTQPTASADITAATLTVTADSKTRPYGAANPELTATITGFVGGDTAAVLTGAPSLATGAGAASLPGPYTITAALGTLSATNYTFSFADGTLTVRKLVLADWEEANFTEFELLDPTISGPDADPDLDGVPNLLEYAFGTDPNDPDSGPDGLVYEGSILGGGSLVETGQPISAVEVTGSGTVTRVLFLRRTSSFTDGLTYVVEFTSNNTTWVNSTATPTVLASDGLIEVVAVPYQLVTGGKKTRDFRVVPSLSE